MKTAQQWLQEWTGSTGCNTGKAQVFITAQDIQEIQADALAHFLCLLADSIKSAEAIKES